MWCKCAGWCRDLPRLGRAQSQPADFSHLAIQRFYHRSSLPIQETSGVIPVVEGCYARGARDIGSTVRNRSSGTGCVPGVERLLEYG